MSKNKKNVNFAVKKAFMKIRNRKRDCKNAKAWKANIILVPLKNTEKRKEFYEKWAEVFVEINKNVKNID